MTPKKILENTFTVGSLTALSRVLGLVREMLQSRIVGAGVAQSAFTLAFAIPNMARKLFGEGALTAAFVPVFRRVVENEGREKAHLLARTVMTGALLVLAAVSLLSVAGIAAVLSFAGRFAFSGRTCLTLSLVAILAPYMFAICGAAFGMGVLNSVGRFKAAGFTPSLLNIVWIAALAVLFAFPSMSPGDKAVAVAWAILAGGFVQFAFLAWRMSKAGFAPVPRFAGRREESVRLVWRNTWIAAAGTGAVQLNYMLDQVLAQAASPWAAGVIGYAERLMDLPLGIIGVAFGTVLLPAFSSCFAKKDFDGARKAMVSSLSSLLFVMIPASAGLALLSRETVGAIYEGGEFDAVATVRVSRALAVYSFGLCLYSFHKVLIPWFQAQNDMKTPVRTTVATVVLNASLNILAVVLLPEEWRHVGLAFSTVVCAAVACVVLAACARRKNGSLGLAAVWRLALKQALAAAAMCVVLILVRPCIASLFVSSGAISRSATLLLLVISGVAVYLAVAFVLRAIPRLR